jgi:6-phosphofructokinase 1
MTRTKTKKMGVLTGGGDVPGLNAAIRAVARRSFEKGFEVLGVRDGYKGLIEGDLKKLTMSSVSGILHIGGTVLGTSRTNPLKREEDLRRCLDVVKTHNLEALVTIGGDDTLGVAYELFKRGVGVVGVPKTMDNDVAETDYCIGFDSAVSIVADALDKLHTTASAHHRAIVVEVMGRYAGWVAVVGGLAGGADFITIPEKPCTIDEICKHLNRRREGGKRFSIIVVAEGAKFPEVVEEGEEKEGRDEFGHVRLDRRGIGATIAKEIERRSGVEARTVVLGHLQRGGSPTLFDRVLATRLGVAAVDLIGEGKFGYMVAYKGNRVVPVELKKVAGKTRFVDLELYRLAQVFY